MILSGESSEKQFDAISEMISKGGERLNRWTKVCKERYPGYEHDIPKDCGMNLGKLSSGGTVNSDTCNAARKTRIILVSKIKQAATELNIAGSKVLEVDCWNHLRNVWLGGMSKVLSSHLRNNLINDFDSIDARLRVSPKIENIHQAVDNEFGLTANYPKGHREYSEGGWKLITQVPHRFMWRGLQGQSKTSVLREPEQSIGITNVE